MIFKQNIIVLTIFLLAVSNAQFTNPGCSKYSANNICLECFSRYFLSFGLCMPVSPLCLTYDSSNGNCLTCYEGFGLNGTSCSLIPIPNCMVSSLLNGCVQCEQGYTLNSRKCFKDVADCESFSFTTGSCQLCKSGYEKHEQTCRIVPIGNCLDQISLQCLNCTINYILHDNTCHQKDPKCSLYENITCIVCSQTFELLNNKCQPTVQSCLNYDSERRCIKCEMDFKLNNGNCILNQDLQPFEQFCRQFGQNECLNCSIGYYLDSQNHCLQIDQYCKLFNYATNLCEQCYTGYSIESNQCVISQEKLDPNCHIFIKSVCTKCSNGYRFDQQGKCIMLDAQCKNFTDLYECQECYPGYMINVTDGLCIISSNKLCLSWGQGSCIKCTPDSYWQSGNCVLIDQYCSKFNFTTSRCVSCYLGYILSQDQTKCNLLIAVSTNYNCASYNSDYACLKCYMGYYLKMSDCVLADPNCKTYNQLNGFCTSCYRGYFLIRTTGRCKRY